METIEKKLPWTSCNVSTALIGPTFEFKEEIKSMGGRWDDRLRVWRVENSNYASVQEAIFNKFDLIISYDAGDADYFIKHTIYKKDKNFYRMIETPKGKKFSITSIDGRDMDHLGITVLELDAFSKNRG